MGKIETLIGSITQLVNDPAKNLEELAILGEYLCLKLVMMENNSLDIKYMLFLLSTNLDNHLKKLSELRSQHSLQ